MELSWEKRIHCDGENAEGFVAGYLAGSDVKFWYLFALGGLAFSLGMFIGTIM